MGKGMARGKGEKTGKGRTPVPGCETAKVATLKCGGPPTMLRRIGVRGQKSLNTAAVDVAVKSRRHSSKQVPVPIRRKSCRRLQWRSHTSGVRGVPVRKIHIFGMRFLSVIGLRVKPSRCANIFVN